MEALVRYGATVWISAMPAHGRRRGPPGAQMSLDDLTLLVVDDDPEVREVAVTACEEMGLTVLSAEDGAGALKILHENPEIELLLTDIAMPNMTGWELAHAAKQKYPDLKIIYT